MLRSCLLSTLLIACTTPASSPTGYYPAPVASAPLAPAPVATAQPPAPAPPPPPQVAGVVRTDGQATTCDQIIAVHPDGGASLLCLFTRESACAVRHVGPDGEDRGRSDLVPGSCADWVSTADGGGIMVTYGKGYHELAFTALDAAGRRRASTALTSKTGVFAQRAVAAPDGGLFAAIAFTGDLAYRGRRLGKTAYTVKGIVRFPATLDRLAWSRLFGTRRTDIVALLPSTRAEGVDAILETRGPLVPGGPMDPPVNPEDGSVFGGDTYGWRAEHVAFDRRGKPRARQELSTGPRRSVYDAALVDGTLATLGPNPVARRGNMITMRPAGGEPAQLEVGFAHGLRSMHGRTWVISNGRAHVDGKDVTTWAAREVGGAGRTLALDPTWRGKAVRWTAIAVVDDRVVALGQSVDPSIPVPITVLALARLPASAPALELETLGLVDEIGIHPTCRGVRSKLGDIVARIHQADAALAACGVQPGARASVTESILGGLGMFSIEGATAETVACVRRVIEPLFLCPPEKGGTHAIQLRR